MTVQFEYVATVCGGRGDRVWDKEITVKAETIRHALVLVELQVINPEVRIVAIQEKD